MHQILYENGGRNGELMVLKSVGLASHPGGVSILLVASCYGNWDKLRQCGPLWNERRCFLLWQRNVKLRMQMDFWDQMLPVISPTEPVCSKHLFPASFAFSGFGIIDPQDPKEKRKTELSMSFLETLEDATWILMFECADFTVIFRPEWHAHFFLVVSKDSSLKRS